MSQSRRMLTALLVMSLLTTLGIGLVSMPSSATTTSLTVEGRSGSVALSLTDLQGMTVVQGYSSYQNSLGNWRGAGTYVGVSVQDLVGLVGGMSPGDTVTIYASDNYNATFSYYNAYNAWPDPSIQGSMIIAYSYNGNTTPTWVDGLRVVFLPSDQGYSNADFLATTTPDMSSGSAGARWVSSVARLVVNPAPWTVTTKKDTATMTYGGQQIANMTSVTAWGGYRKSTGAIVGPDNYTGVNVSYLLQWVGGMSSTDSLKLVSRDLYQQTFNYSVAMGSSTVWTILAYKMNGSWLLPSDVPRIALVGPDSPITSSGLWQKAVSSMEVIANRPPILQPLSDVLCNASETVSFSASATDPDGNPLQYTWDFGDESALMVGQTVSHAYSTAGTYTFTVYVDDMTGLAGHNVSASATATVAFNLDLYAGWNLVGIPLLGTGFKASNIGLQTGDAVVGFNRTTQTYDKTYVVGVSPPIFDFALIPGVGYWIYSGSGETIHLVGEVPTTAQSVPVNVPAGGGWVMFVFVGLKTHHASDLPGMYSGSMAAVAIFEQPSSIYKTYIVGLPMTDFAIPPGLAVWIRCTTSGTLTYSP